MYAPWNHHSVLWINGSKFFKCFNDNYFSANTFVSFSLQNHQAYELLKQIDMSVCQFCGLLPLPALFCFHFWHMKMSKKIFSQRFPKDRSFLLTAFKKNIIINLIILTVKYSLRETYYLLLISKVSIFW